jgi:hypothetical protein
LQTRRWRKADSNGVIIAVFIMVIAAIERTYL